MRIDFYHLQKSDFNETLTLLLPKILQSEDRAIIRLENNSNVKKINDYLWSYSEEAWLPHGSEDESNASMQPVFITSEDKNPNESKFLLLGDGVEPDVEFLKSFDRVLNIFDGKNEYALEKSRNFWKKLKSEGFDLGYWQQEDSGKWNKAL